MRFSRFPAAFGLSLGVMAAATAAQPLPVFDVHVHYSHDAVELTPPDAVVALMREAGLSHALVSSSDARGTLALRALAPDMIVPGLRPYRQRGEIGSWVRDPGALAYVERLLAEHRWASLGEFHLYGEDADLPIPRRLARLSVVHGLVLHAHSDADAVRRLFAAEPRARILWAHAGFAAPETVAQMLEAYPGLWADLAFRGEIGADGGLTSDWRRLFERFPGRLMLGTDTFTPERIHFIPEHARRARAWLSGLPPELAERLAWRNAADLLLPVWNRNREAAPPCGADDDDAHHVRVPGLALAWRAQPAPSVSGPFAIEVRVCGEGIGSVSVDSDMPAHGHGMNYAPQRVADRTTDAGREARFEGLLWHMPGEWRISFAVEQNGRRVVLHDTVEMP